MSEKDSQPSQAGEEQHIAQWIMDLIWWWLLEECEEKPRWFCLCWVWINSDLWMYKTEDDGCMDPYIDILHIAPLTEGDIVITFLDWHKSKHLTVNIISYISFFATDSGKKVYTHTQSNCIMRVTASLCGRKTKSWMKSLIWVKIVAQENISRESSCVKRGFACVVHAGNCCNAQIRVCFQEILEHISEGASSLVWLADLTLGETAR